MVDSAAAPPSAQTPRPAKRSFFKRPAWATAEETKAETETGSESFSHSSRVFQEIIEEQQKKEKEKEEAKRKEKEERRAKRKSDESEGRHGKRRRASRDGEGSESCVQRNGGRDSSRTPQLASPSRKATRSTANPASLSARYEDALKPPTPRKNNASTTIIDLGDDSETDDSLGAATTNKVSPSTTTPIILDDDSDANLDLEDTSITLQMREHRRQVEAPARPLNSTTISANSPPKPDPVVKILITSPIPGTKPLLVDRKLSQRLREVREIWCVRQEFPPGITKDTVFLSYRNHRLWDVATCKSIGLEVDEHGTLRQKNEHDVFDDMDGKVHLVAVTQEILADMKRRAELGLDESDSVEEEKEEEQVLEDKPKFRLFLKARGHDDFKLCANADSTFEQVANAFRSHYKVGADKRIFLMFDGDRLEPQDAVKDSEVQDMDAVEVHIK